MSLISDTSTNRLQEKDWKDSPQTSFNSKSKIGNSFPVFEKELEYALSVTCRNYILNETTDSDNDAGNSSSSSSHMLFKIPEIEIDASFDYCHGNIIFKGAYPIADSAKIPDIMAFTSSLSVKNIPKAYLSPKKKPINNYREHFSKNFGLCVPNLTLILPSSNTCSTVNETRNPDANFMKSFLSDLRYIIHNTDTWLITNGLNWGLTKTVGENIGSRVLSPFTSETVELIGIQSFESLPLNIKCRLSDLASRMNNKDTLEVQRGYFEENHSLFVCMKDGFSTHDSTHADTFWETIDKVEVVKQTEEIRNITRRESLFKVVSVSTPIEALGDSLAKKDSISESAKEENIALKPLVDVENNKVDDDDDVMRTGHSPGPRISSKIQDKWFNDIEFQDPDVNPAVCIILDNSPEGFLHVLHAVRRNLPIILVLDSGLTADVSAYLVQLSRETNKFLTLMDEVMTFVVQNYPRHKLSIVKSVIEELFLAIKNNVSLFTIYHPLRNGINDLNKGIFLSLLKAYKGNNKRLYGLLISFRWKNVDIALEKIFIGREKWIQPQDERGVQRIFFSNLVHNNIDFVHRMLDSKIIDLSYYGNLYYMSQLYHRSFRHICDHNLQSTVKKMLRLRFGKCNYRKDPRFVLLEMGSLIEAMMGNNYDCYYNSLLISRKEVKQVEFNFTQNIRNCMMLVKTLRTLACKCCKLDDLKISTKNRQTVAQKAQILFETFPEENLFIWAIIFHRWEMAKLFLRYCDKTCLTTALAGARLIRGMKILYQNRTDVDERARFSLEKEASNFEDIAKSLLIEIHIIAGEELKTKLVLKNFRVIHKPSLCSEQSVLVPVTPVESDDVTNTSDNGYIWPWSNENSLEMAMNGGNKHFIAEPLIQDYANQKWYGNVRRLNAEWKLFVCLLLPFLSPFLLEIHSFRKRFEHRINPSADSSIDEKKFRQKSFFHFILFIIFDYFRTIYNFYNAPKIKFWMHAISHVSYTLLFTIVSVTPYQSIKKFSDPQSMPWLILEIIVWFWAFTILLEELNQILGEKGSILTKIKSYLSIVWNMVDVLTLFGVFLAMALKLADVPFHWVQTIYAFVIVLLYIRIYQYLIISDYFGVIILTIQALIGEVLYFSVILFIGLIGFGVATQTVVASEAPLEDFNPGILLFTLFFRQFWQIFGEFFLTQLPIDITTAKIPEQSVHTEVLFTELFNSSAISNRTNATSLASNSSQFCTVTSSYIPSSSYIEFDYFRFLIPYIMLVLWLMYSNVLLINLLIAKFNNIYLEVEANSSILWKHTRFYTIQEFRFKPLLPPPFIIISHLRRLLKLIYKHYISRIIYRNLYKEKQKIFHLKNEERWKLTKGIQKQALARWQKKEVDSNDSQKLMHTLHIIDAKLDEVYHNCHSLLDHQGSDEPVLAHITNELRDIRRQMTNFNI